ncbi:ABC-F family ATP-binding cassette domain-containing protein [Sphaerochaeta sp. UBA5836]|uniref:ABC-F family ATP-binding cassette domain-containing protein n=1 Tax=Sphaerochaeta sp. UBA5836 TaxID=1947474 RepID=UPI0025F8CDF4|nr:ABC-F family ATP-binding cassette domain-containing protein [Sphaerochaeta sp. UBA5836]
MQRLQSGNLRPLAILTYTTIFCYTQLFEEYLVVKLSGVTVAYGDRFILKDADFLIKNGDRIGLVGPNGAGKTTLLRVLAGEEQPDSGQVLVDNNTVIGYFSQNVGEMQGRSALMEVIAGSGSVYEIGLELERLEHRMADADQAFSDADMERYGQLQTEFLARDGYDLTQRSEEILTGLGIGPDRFHEPVEHFSGGWKMRIALAKILALNPDVLLMDEPTNHLDLESIIYLESWLASFNGDVVMTSHDRQFMTRICKRTVEVANAQVTSYSGDYDFYIREREIRREQLIATYNRQQARFAKDEEFIAKFAARASHASLVQSRIKALEKIERITLPPESKIMHVQFAPCPRSGDQVVVLKDLTKRWPKAQGGEHTVFEHISGVVMRGNKIALTGINGAGKSTLLKVIVGLAEASGGEATLGASVNMGYFSQYSSDVLDPNKTIFEEVFDRVPLSTIPAIRSMLGSFLFSGDDVDKKIGTLSGGEKSRVMLACMLAVPVNFLVLDEPTNHLDIQSREVLLDALSRFEGTLMIVSHDRYFLKHLANRVFELDKGMLNIYEGDYAYYLHKSGRE